MDKSVSNISTAEKKNSTKFPWLFGRISRGYSQKLFFIQNISENIFLKSI